MTKIVYVPEHILTETAGHLRRRGRHDKEGLVLWAGVTDQSGNSWITTFFTAGGRWAHGVKLDFKQMLRMTEATSKNKTVLLAQVHNHPGTIPHSFGDDQNPASHREGYLSIVVPHMGLRNWNLPGCFVYEYRGDLNWRELSEGEKTEQLVVVPEKIKL